MKLKINAKNYKTSAKSLFALRDELGFNSNDISIYKGFATNEDLALNDGDSVVFIKKGELPPKDALKEMMQARNSPELNAALERANVGIAGLGGLGSAVAIALARVGVAKLMLVDFDTIDPSNLNRQQYFIDDIGKAKTAALKQIISRINPFVEVCTRDIYLDESNVNEVFAPCNIVAECFDNTKSKAMLINSLKNKQIIAASGVAGYGASEDIKITRFANNVWICGDLANAAAIGNGLMAPRVGIAAMMQANKILELLMQGMK